MDCIRQIKIVIVGDSGVGKSCIIGKFSKGTKNDELESDVGAFTECFIKINNTSIKCDLWDTPGQELYISINRLSYVNANIICLVYDTTNKNSFENIEKIWLPNLKDCVEKNNVFLALIGNKSDLFQNEAVNELEARDYAKSINASFFLTSAKIKDDIDSFFKDLVSQYLGPEFLMKINSLNEEKMENFGLEDLNNDKKKRGCCGCMIF